MARGWSSEHRSPRSAAARLSPEPAQPGPPLWISINHSSRARAILLTEPTDLIGVNRFEGAQPYEVDEVRAALDLDPFVPIQLCDARQRESTKRLLITLMEHIMFVTGFAPRATADQ